MVRVWCVAYSLLDDRRLLGQHVESHTLISVERARLEGRKCGYQSHPEAVKYRGRVGELVAIHNAVAEEMLRRGFRHQSPVTGDAVPHVYTAEEMRRDEEDLKRRQGGLLRNDAKL